jgi:L-seryl-tRNA(Ser) seleniumtransferase
MTDPRRQLPSVDRLLKDAAVAALAEGVPRSALVRAVRRAIDDARAAPETAPADAAGWAAAVARTLAGALRPTLRRTINATGVVLHTNLGRAPLSEAALAAIREVAGGYSTLEYDAERGRRGDRHVHCAGLLTELTGAPAALVVNNAASALLLALATAAAGGDVVVSRGELIEIGGGFRIPEILEKSGARLVEVGTTNRTRLADYAQALKVTAAEPRKRGGTVGRRGERRSPCAILKVHRSNFRQEGFVAEASLAELVALGRRRRVPVIYDLGGGLMVDLSADGLGGEPLLPEAARSGATAVVASGDKLLGGPQAGILVGTAPFVTRCRTNPLARAFRADKLTFAALSATLALYRDPAVARRAVPVLRMLTEPRSVLAARAERLAAALPAAAHAVVTATRAAVGGGAFPGVELASAGVALAPADLPAATLAERLRLGPTPVVALVSGGRVVLDVRTIPPEDESPLADAVAAALR